ncbi:MAG: hypothetical protein ACE363_16145 [Alphaproteobacteria bacterium]
MEKHLVIIKSNAVAGREADYEAWYNNIHLGEVLQVPGFLTGQQYRTPPSPDGSPPSHSHTAVFEVESDDITATLTQLGEEFASGRMTATDALDTNTAPESVVMLPTGARQQAA